MGGNHTDHQHGRVLAAAVNLDILAAAAPNQSGMIRVQSQGYPLIVVDLGELTPKAEEQNTSAALIRGVAARMSALGCPLRNVGLDVYITSTVPGGSGLSSSAAFEVLIGTMLNDLFWDGKCTPVEIAQIGQYAENVFFGKPCGLMDQTASSGTSRRTSLPKQRQTAFSSSVMDAYSAVRSAWPAPEFRMHRA